MLAHADLYNKQVRIEKLHNTFMMIDHTTKQQVGVLGGEIAAWAAAAYPSDAHLASPVVKGMVAKMVAGDGAGAASYAAANMSVLEGAAGLRKRAFLKVCGGCFLFWSCIGNKGGDGCEDHFCLAVVCIGYE